MRTYGYWRGETATAIATMWGEVDEIDVAAAEKRDGVTYEKIATFAAYDADEAEDWINSRACTGCQRLRPGCGCWECPGCGDLAPGPRPEDRERLCEGCRGDA